MIVLVSVFWFVSELYHQGIETEVGRDYIAWAIISELYHQGIETYYL